MSDFLIGTLRTLSEIVGTSGDEGAVRRALRPLVAPHVDEVRTDAMGNLIALKRGTGQSGERVLVTAHMDEVGLMVRDYTSEGELRIGTVGGISAQLLPGLQVVVGPEQIPGVIGLKAIHRLKREEWNRVPPVDELVVDIGAKDKDEARRIAPPGTRIAFTTTFRELGPSIAGKAFDDRAGCTILAALLREEPYPFDLYGVFTVQEEVGLRGAMVAAYAVDPRVAFCLEGTLADDLPKREEMRDTSPTTALGKGPAITVMDRSYVTPPWLLRHLIETAEAEGIPYQLKQPGISGTEPGAIHRARGGVAAVTVAVPCRYIHGPVALTRRSDLEHTFALVRAALRRLPPALK